MNRIRAILLASLLAALPAADAVAQSREALMGSFRQDRAREESREGRRMSITEVQRVVRSRCRPGRWLGAQETNPGRYQVRLERERGEIAFIYVDGRSGAVSGDC